MLLPGITSEKMNETLMSVGSHRTTRPLSPVEVAINLRTAELAGASRTKIASALGFSGSSMISKFQKLLTLSPKIQYLVDWGESTKSSVGFSVAVELSGLKETEHELMINSIIKHGLTKTEVKSVRQLNERSGRPLSECINDIISRRSQTRIQHIIIGQVILEHLRVILSKLKQLERDEIIKLVIKELYPDLEEFSAKMGNNQFAIFGGKSVGDSIGKDAQFESKVNDALSKNLLDNA